MQLGVCGAVSLLHLLFAGSMAYLTRGYVLCANEVSEQLFTVTPGVAQGRSACCKECTVDGLA